MMKLFGMMVFVLLAWVGTAPAAQKTAPKTATKAVAAKTAAAKGIKARAAVGKAVAAPLPEIKPSAPPAGIIAAGTRFATPYFMKTTGVDGPRVIILGGVHGDEISGATAAALIEQWPIVRGTMMVIPRSNVPGLAVRTRKIPAAEKGLEDLNRNFPRARRDEPARGEAAAALWTRIREFKPDWVIDLHEGFAIHQQNKSSVGSSVITTTGTACLNEAHRLQEAVNATIPDAKKHFDLLRVPVDGSIARAASEHLGAGAMILETTSKGQPLEVRTSQHRAMVRTLLSDLKMVE